MSEKITLEIPDFTIKEKRVLARALQEMKNGGGPLNNEENIRWEIDNIGEEACSLTEKSIHFENERIKGFARLINAVFWNNESTEIVFSSWARVWFCILGHLGVEEEWKEIL